MVRYTPVVVCRVAGRSSGGLKVDANVCDRAANTSCKVEPVPWGGWVDRLRNTHKSTEMPVKVYSVIVCVVDVDR